MNLLAVILLPAQACSQKVMIMSYFVHKPVIYCLNLYHFIKTVSRNRARKQGNRSRKIKFSVRRTEHYTYKTDKFVKNAV